MVTYTSRLNAVKAASSENVDVVTHLNNPYDLFDSAVGATVGTSASRPASAFNGRLYYTSDSTKLFVNTGTNPSTVASWADPVANALLGNVQLGGSVAASAGSVDLTRSASASNSLTVAVAGDSQKRLAVTAGGVLNLGSGSGAADTNLYRSAANTLATDDTLVAAAVTSVGTLTASTAATVGTTLTVGTGLTVTAGKGQKTLVRKSTSTGRISTTTVTNDPHITFTLAASGVYLLRAFIAVSGAAAGDFKCAWNGTTGASGAMSLAGRHCYGPDVGVTSIGATTIRSQFFAWTFASSYGTDGSNVTSLNEEGIIDNSSGGSGSWTLQWAQNSSTATSTVLTADTWAILERLV